MNRPPDPCHLCARFQFARYAKPEYAYCEGFEIPRRYDETNAACPLWNRAKNERERRDWASKQTRETT